MYSTVSQSTDNRDKIYIICQFSSDENHPSKMSGRPQRIIKLTDKIKNPNNVAEREGTHRKQFAQASALHPADSEASISALSSNVSTAENTALSHTAPSQSQPSHPEPEESFEIAVAPPAVVSEENGDLESDSEPVHIPKG